jgi:hypothetical protein
MQQLYINANSVSPMGDVNTVLLSENAMANYRRALFVNERYINEKTLDGGRMSLAFAGASVEQDIELGFNATSSAASFNKTAPVSGYMINYNGIKLVFHQDADFAVSPFEQVSGTTARAAQLYVKVQLVGDHLGSCGVLFDGDTF